MHQAREACGSMRDLGALQTELLEGKQVPSNEQCIYTAIHTEKAFEATSLWKLRVLTI